MIDIPRTYLAGLLAIVVLLVAGAAAGGGWVVRGWQADRDLAELRELHEQAKQRQTEQHARDLVRVINRGDALAQAAEQDAHDARTQALAARRTAAALDAVSGRLREHVARLAAAYNAASEPAAPAFGSPPAAGPGLVLADLWGSSEDEARELGPALDEARARGLRCERNYDRARDALSAMNAEAQ